MTLYAPWIDRHDPLAGLPKVSLHDHLDGSLLPTTLIEFALQEGVRLPTEDPDELERWFRGDSDLPGVGDWVELFAMTTAVMQSEHNLRRIAREWVQTAALDGVVYGETRWAPEQHIAGGLSLDEAVRTVGEGLAEGMEISEAGGRPIVARQLLSIMRHRDNGLEIARLAARTRADGVVGIDLAGREDDNPASRHRAAFREAESLGVPMTLHAGEHAGVDSLLDTLESGRPLRIGHGIRLIEDVRFDGRQVPIREALAAWDGIDHDFGRVELGPVIRRVIESATPIEVAPQSNSHGSVVDDRLQHPVDLLRRLGVAVTISPDNRLVSGTSMTREFRELASLNGWTHSDFADVTRRAMRAAFVPPELQQHLIDTVIDPGYATPPPPRKTQ